MENNTENTEKKLEELTIIEIKALLYDQILILERTKNNINILQNELNKKNTEKDGTVGAVIE